jgi:myo-inositol-1(or 4)-monophosphatase
MHPMLNTAIKAARRGASILNRASFDLDKISITAQQFQRIKTDIEPFVFESISETLQNAYPGHVIADSNSLSFPFSKEVEHLWVIQPLDGAINFIHGHTQYALSITLIQRGVITHSLVYDPNRNDLFIASKGEGAFKNDKRIRVSKRHKISDCLFASSNTASKAEDLDTFFAQMQTLSKKSHGVVSLGCISLDLANVATGQIEGAFFKGLSLPEMLAGSLLITEAGGIVGDYQGETRHLENGELITANAKIYAQLLPILSVF